MSYCSGDCCCCGMKFRDEFSRKKFFFGVDCADESKNVFVQSKIDLISPSVLLIFRMAASIYFLFGMLVSVTTHQGSHPWTAYMTSLNYLLVLIFFIYGFTLSTYAVFFRKSYYRNLRGASLTRKCNIIQNSTKDVVMTIMPNVYQPNTCSPVFRTKSKRNVDLVQNRYSIDALVFNLDDVSAPAGEKINPCPSKCKNKDKNKGPFGSDNNNNNNNNTKNSHSNSKCSHQIKRSIPEEDSLLRQPHELPGIPWETIVTAGGMKLGLFFKIYWFLSATVLNLTTLTVIVYWTLMYPQQTDPMTELKWFLRVDRHGIVLFFLLLEHFLSGIPTRVFHFVYPCCLLSLYGLTSAIYTILTHDYVYTMLNFYSSPLKSTLFLVGACFVATPVVQVLLYWSVYRLREKCFKDQP